MAAPGTRRWSLEAARAVLPEVRSRTASAVPEVETLLAERDALDPQSQVTTSLAPLFFTRSSAGSLNPYAPSVRVARSGATSPPSCRRIVVMIAVAVIPSQS